MTTLWTCSECDRVRQCVEVDGCYVCDLCLEKDEEHEDDKVDFLMSSKPEALRECVDILAANQVALMDRVKRVEANLEELYCRVNIVLWVLVIGAVFAMVRIIS